MVGSPDGEQETLRKRHLGNVEESTSTPSSSSSSSPPTGTIRILSQGKYIELEDLDSFLRANNITTSLIQSSPSSTSASRGTNSTQWRFMLLFIILILSLILLGIYLSSRTETEVEDDVLKKQGWSALGCVFVRYLLTSEWDSKVKANDTLASIFLTPYGRFSGWFYVNITPLRNFHFWLSRWLFPGLIEHLLIRHRLGDELLMEAVSSNPSPSSSFSSPSPNHPQQVVILGAGYETRAIRHYSLLSSLAIPIFEVDLGGLQHRKLDILHQSFDSQFTETHPLLHFIPCDFASGSESFVFLLQDMIAKGFDTLKPTLFFWEGVSMYLEPSSIDLTLSFIHRSSPANSLLFFDYFTSCVTEQQQREGGVEEQETARRRLSACNDDIQMQAGAWRLSLNHAAHDEPLKFGIEHERLDSFLSSRGFVLQKQFNNSTFLEEKFLRRKDGSTFGHYLPYIGLALARTKESG